MRLPWRRRASTVDRALGPARAPERATATPTPAARAPHERRPLTETEAGILRALISTMTTGRAEAEAQLATAQWDGATHPPHICFDVAIDPSTPALPDGAARYVDLTIELGHDTTGFFDLWFADGRLSDLSWTTLGPEPATSADDVANQLPSLDLVMMALSAPRTAPGATVQPMSDYSYGGAGDIDRAIAYFTQLDDEQKNALAVLEIDQVIDELQAEYDRATADPDYRPSDDFLVRLADYLGQAGDAATP